MRARKRIERGRHAARWLEGAWRPTPPAITRGGDSLDELAPLFLSHGAGPLAWRRLRLSDGADVAAAQILKETYQYNVLRTARITRDLGRISAALRGGGVEAIVVKGWAVGLFYPEPGLRPFGDMDLAVDPSLFTRAREILSQPDLRIHNVDLHAGFERLDSTPWREMFERSALVGEGDAAVRVLAPEDHLRVVCRHLMRHGAVRMIWACDVAVMVEARPARFDWALCFGPARSDAQWVRAACGLASDLLGAERAAPGQGNQTLPRWLVSSVLREWGARFRASIPLSQFARRPAGLLDQLPRHWPNPLEASFALDATLTTMPRLPYQVAHCAIKAARFARRRLTTPASC